jgi:hypothetical protein
MIPPQEALLGRSSIIFIDPCGDLCELLLYFLRITLFLLVFGFHLFVCLDARNHTIPPMHYPPPPFIIDEDPHHARP